MELETASTVREYKDLAAAQFSLSLDYPWKFFHHHLVCLYLLQLLRCTDEPLKDEKIEYNWYFLIFRKMLHFTVFLTI
jgi:hypothetical protein